MLNKLFGWYVYEKFKGRGINITFEQTLASGASSSFSLTDAEDGAELLGWLSSDNFILWDVYAIATPGFVKLVVKPDNEAIKKFRFAATSIPNTITLIPPKLVEVDLIVEYENESQANNIFINFSGMRISEENYAKFITFSELIPASLEHIDLQTLNSQKLLANIQLVGQGIDPEYELPKIYPTVAKNKEFCKRRD